MIDRGLRLLKSHNCLIYTRYASLERIPGEVCLKTEQGSYMKLTLKIASYCIVGITTLILVPVNTEILLP